MVLSDTAFHAAEGDPTNLKLCQRGAWEDRMLVETVALHADACRRVREAGLLPLPALRTGRESSLHPAQASQRPCEGPVSIRKTCWLHDTSHASIPLRGSSTSGASPPTFATPSLSILTAFSCRDTAGKSARLRVESCCLSNRRNPYPSNYRTAFAFSHPHTRTAVGWPCAFLPFLRKERYGLTTFHKIDKDG